MTYFKTLTLIKLKIKVHVLTDYLLILIHVYHYLIFASEKSDLKDLRRDKIEKRFNLDLL